MMKSALLVLFVALLCAYAEGTAYKAKCDSVAACKAKASVKINLRGPGKCSATAQSFCAAWAKDSGDCFNKETLYINLKKCRDVDVAIDAKCWAKAAAKAIAKAAVETDCVSKKPKYSFACGAASADATAVACALAEAIVKLSVSIGFHDNAVCEAEVAAAVDAIASATASADAFACSKNGIPASDSEFALAKAIEKAVVKVFASCWVYCDDTGKEVDAKAVADGDAIGFTKDRTKEIEKGGGEATAQTGH